MVDSCGVEVLYQGCCFFPLAEEYEGASSGVEHCSHACEGFEYLECYQDYDPGVALLLHVDGLLGDCELFDGFFVL